MGKPDPPAPPNYGAAAVATADASKEVATIQNHANRPDQIGPYGSVTWDQNALVDPSTGQNVTKWTQNTNLRPELEDSLQSEVNQQKFRSGLSESLMGRMETGLDELADFSQFGDIGRARGDAEDLSYGFQTSRLDPDWAERSSDLDINLRNQGLRPGDEAYDREQRNYSEGRNDAYAGARAQAQSEGRSETELAQKLRQQAIGEYLTERTTPINEVNALSSGQQVNTPQMPTFASASRSQSADYLGAAQADYGAAVDGYNINSANRQSSLNGIFSAGRAAAGFL